MSFRQNGAEFIKLSMCAAGTAEAFVRVILQFILIIRCLRKTLNKDIEGDNIFGTYARHRTKLW
jgi:hypothetical protein